MDGRWCRARLQCVCMGIGHDHESPPTLESGTLETRPCPSTVAVSRSSTVQGCTTTHASARCFGMLPLPAPHHAGLMSSNSGPPALQASLALYLWLGAASRAGRQTSRALFACSRRGRYPGAPMAEVADDHSQRMASRVCPPLMSVVQSSLAI